MKYLWHKIKEIEERNGILFIDGCNTLEIVEHYGTPLYVYSENRIRKNYRRLLKAYSQHYPKFAIYYAIKANNNLAIVRTLSSEGAGADCSCLGELEIAEKAGIPYERQIFSAAFPSQETLSKASEQGVLLNLENVSDLDRLPSTDTSNFLSFRINPGIGGSGSEGLVFSGKDAKFGIVESQVEDAYSKAQKKGFKKFGVHMMTGSNILSPKYFEEITIKLLDIIGPITQKLGIVLEFIDIGGSLGTPYLPDEKELDINLVAEKTVCKLKKKLKEYQMGEPFLIHEPGRYLVADAGILLSKVTSIKETEQTFIGIDAGMNTFLRPALYNTYHHILLANRLKDPCDKNANVVGPICENTDQFAKNRALPSSISIGDTLAFLDAGAYGFSMSSQYNTHPRPAEVLACSGNAELIRKRENLSDLWRGVEVPKHLAL